MNTKSNTQSFRISPRGMINLALKERQALRFVEGQGRLVDVKVEGGTVQILPADKPGPDTVKASPRGVLQLPSEAHKALSGGNKGRYALTSEAGERGKQAYRSINLRPA